MSEDSAPKVSIIVASRNNEATIEELSSGAYLTWTIRKMPLKFL